MRDAANPPLYCWNTGIVKGKLWMSNDVIRVVQWGPYVDPEKDYNFSGIDKRLPSSFFSLEGFRLGMTEEEAWFVKSFVWEFKDYCDNEKLNYNETAMARLFPNITKCNASEVSCWKKTVYEIVRHYDKWETSKIGGYSRLEKILTKKLGCGAKIKKQSSYDDLSAPMIKPCEFDFRYDPYMIWELPEKDLQIVLREIHGYDKTETPIEPDRIKCDLIIRSLELMKQKKEAEKAAREAAPVGF